jgi:hypothetical protein
MPKYPATAKVPKGGSVIYVRDNFIPEKKYNLICEDVLKADYTPPPEKNRKAVEEGSGTPGGSYWFEKKIPLDCEVALICKKLIKDKFNYKVKRFHQCCYTIVVAEKQFAPHIDSFTAYHCLIYLLGDEKINNGTGFYVKDDKGDLILHTHIGFKQNRAIMFSADNYHAPLLWAGNSSSRYSLANFFD